MAPRPPLKALLLDLSGTLHVGSTAIPGAVQALSRLRHPDQHNGDSSLSNTSSKPIPFRFCSNTSKEGRNELESRLRDMGFELQANDSASGKGREMWTSLGVLGSFLRQRGLKNPFCLLQDSAKEEVLRDLGEGASEAEYDSVVVGLAPSLFSYDNLNTAFRILLSQLPRPLIATHRAKYIRTDKPKSSSSPHDSLSLGPGPFVTALENAAGVEALVVGKPSRAFFETVISSFYDEEMEGEGRVAIVGDDIETDLGGGAIELGLWRVLVKTGKYREGDERRPGVVPPDEVFDSFADFVDSLLWQGNTGLDGRL